jgi:hypothetical protein
MIFEPAVKGGADWPVAQQARAVTPPGTGMRRSRSVLDDIIEIDEPDLAGVPEQIHRLEVAMRDPLPMHRRKQLENRARFGSRWFTFGSKMQPQVRSRAVFADQPGTSTQRPQALLDQRQWCRRRDAEELQPVRCTPGMPRAAGAQRAPQRVAEPLEIVALDQQRAVIDDDPRNRTRAAVLEDSPCPDGFVRRRDDGCQRGQPARARPR